MTDRLTDADLKELERRIVDGQSVDVLWVGPLLAEVREHRAARTLTDDERAFVKSVRRHCDAALRAGSGLKWTEHLLAIIDRLTWGSDRDRQ